MVVPHPEKVSPTSKASLRPHFGYGGEDAYYCGWGPRCARSYTPGSPLA